MVYGNLRLLCAFNLQTQWPSVPQSLPKILRPFMLVLKPLVQFLVLLYYLCFKIPAPDVFLVQVSLNFSLKLPLRSLFLV